MDFWYLSHKHKELFKTHMQARGQHCGGSVYLPTSVMYASGKGSDEPAITLA